MSQVEETDPELLRLSRIRPITSTVRKKILCRQIELDPLNQAMVACSRCADKGLGCYFDKTRSSKCTNCTNSNVSCSGSFSVFELRSVSEEKKRIEAKAREKRKQMLKLRKAMMDARKALQEAEEAFSSVEIEEVALSDSVKVLDDKIDNMLKREMQALGVLAEMPEEAVVAAAEPENVWAGFPVVQQLDLPEILSLDEMEWPSPVSAQGA